MTFTERCALCQQLRDGYDAELMGLWEAGYDFKRGKTTTNVAYSPPDLQACFERGYREGREILLLEAGQKGEP